MASADGSRAPSDATATDVGPKRLTLTLKMPAKAGSRFPQTASPAAMTPGSALPPSASSIPPTPSGQKIILKPPQTPSGLPPLAPAPTSAVNRRVSVISDAVSPMTTTKAGRTTKPTAKKRAHQDEDEEFSARRPQGPAAIARTGTAAAAKRVKISMGGLKPPQSRPSIMIKKQGRKPVRPPGQGYDSEAEDREDDPVIEEQFVLRMMPGEHAEYVQKAIKEKRIGISRQQGGADISLKWLDDQSRRACLTIEGQAYAAVMVDLPTVTEGMKTWNKKQLVKSADICQMLLAFAKVKSDEEAKHAPLPSMVGKGYTWPHGLTPPMHDCVHRRFRKRLSKLEIQNKEEEVSRLLKADKDAISSTYEFVEDESKINMEGSDEEDYEEEDEDAEGELDADAEGEEDIGYFPPVPKIEEELDPELEDERHKALQEEIEAAFEKELFEDDGDADGGTPADPGDGRTPASAAQSGTPAPAESGAEGDGDSGAEGGADAVEEDGEDDDDEGEMDEEAQARADEIRGVKEDAAELQRQLTRLQADLAKQNNQLLRKRIEGNIKKVKNELQLKLSSIGEEFEA